MSILYHTSSQSKRFAFFALVLLKVFVTVFSDCNISGNGGLLADYPFQYTLHVNPDELDIASVAKNYNAGYNFAANKGYYARRDKQITAWRTTTPVWVHIVAQRLYKSLYPDREITLADRDPYFRSYAFALQCLALLLFWASLYAFYEIAFLFLRSEKWALITTVLYGTMPSVLYYVGSSPGYENIALPLLLIVTAICYRCLENPQRIQWTVTLAAALLAGVATLIRPHTTLIFYAYGGVLLLNAAIRQYRRGYSFSLQPSIRFVLFTWIFLLLIQAPIVYKNYRLFGAVFISNQAGFNFLLGHNEQARGSWLGDSGVGSEWDRWVVQQIPGIERMNEYQEANARKQLATDWIKNNPGKELGLALRKTAIFFLPDNYLHPKEFNPASVFTAVIHLLFGIGLVLYLVALVKSRFAPEYLSQALPYVSVLTALFFSILFFVDHRWRYYADPFILLIAVNTGRFLVGKRYEKTGYAEARRETVSSGTESTIPRQ